MYFVYRDGRYIDATGQSFRDFMAGRLPALPGQLPTLADYENHLTTAFPEVRLKRFLEMRGADNGPWRTICSLSALWVGLLYDTQAQAEATALIADWTHQERAHLRSTVPRLGLDTPFRGEKLQLVAQRVVAIAKGGLQRRGLNEVPFLRNLEDIVASGKSLADQMLDAYPGWGKDGVDVLFEKYTF